MVFVAPLRLWATCPVLVTGTPLTLSGKLGKTACVSVEIAPGEASQIQAQHPDDLVLSVKGPEQRTIDGFQFGTETVSLDMPGHYQISLEILPHPGGEPPAHVNMSRQQISLQAAAQWKSAEAVATASKSSRKLSDIEASLELWKAIGDGSTIGRTRLKLGDALYRAENPAQSLAAYEQAFVDCRTSGDVRCAAEAANNSAVIARNLGDFELSHQRLQDAIEDWRYLHFPSYEGRTLSNLGVLYTRGGDFQLALSTYSRAKELLRDTDKLAYGRVLNNLGLCYATMGEYKKSQIYFEQAVAAGNTLKEGESDVLRARANLGRVLMRQGNLPAARQVLESSIRKMELREKNGQPDASGKAFALDYLGEVLWRSGHPELAADPLNKALTLHRATRDRRGEALALHHLALVAGKMGHVEESRKLLGEAIDFRRAWGLRDDTADSVYELARLEYSEGNHQTAKTLAEEGIRLLEAVRTRVPGAALRASFYARRRNLLDLLVAIDLGEGGAQGAEESFLAADREQSRALLDLVSQQRSSIPGPAELREERTSLRRRIEMAAYRPSGDARQRESILREVQSLVARDEEIEARILESTASLNPGYQPLTTLEDLRNNFLPHDSAILEYHLGEQSGYLWLVTPAETKVFLLPSRDRIEQAIEPSVSLFGRYLERRQDPAAESHFESSMRLLSSMLLGPLKTEKLPDRLLLVLDDDLHRLPFAALRLPNGKYLGVAHDLVRIPSAAYLMHGKRAGLISQFHKTFLAFCDPVFSPEDHREPRFSRIFFKNELQVVSKLVPPGQRTFRCGYDASLDAVEKMPLSEYAIIHFSTHAIVDDQVPELSRIALSSLDRHGRNRDGALFSHQLSDLHLGRSLVVLSACDTALGQKVVGEGLLGFANSLFSAGASQLALTLTEVDSRGSSVFLAEVYRHMLGVEHATPEHAIMLASHNLVRSKSKRWADPYYWASFVIVGMPNGVGER